MAKVLCVEAPYKDIVEYPWNEKTKNKFKFDGDDVRALEKGNVIFINDVAYTVEEEATV